MKYLIALAIVAALVTGHGRAWSHSHHLTHYPLHSGGAHRIGGGDLRP